MSSTLSFPREMHLTRLAEGWPRALSAAMGTVMAECASVCLHKNSHCNEVGLHVEGDHKLIYTLRPLAVTEQILHTHNDPEVAAEYGACGIALLLMEDLTDHTVVERAYKGGGFDYWMGHKDDILFQKKARLEVSGILVGKQSKVLTRLKEKLAQSNPSDSTKKPAYAVVVEFGKPTAHLKKKNVNQP